MVQALLDMLNRAERVLDVDPRQARIFIAPGLTLCSSRPWRDPVSARRPSPWQERKVLRHIGENLDRTISNQELAELAGLSAGHSLGASGAALARRRATT
ncbi:hypothetical protein ACRAWD_22960 [Caulobacter segnis]